MKKFFAMLLCVIVAASSMSTSAKNWRMFTDVNLGVFYGVGASVGYQYKKWFFGGGTEVSIADQDVNIPFFAHIRYDFFSSNPKAFTFWLSYKIGYHIPTIDSGSIHVDASFGLRKMIKENLGLNIGLSLKTVPILENDYYYEGIETRAGVTLNIGLDF